MVEEVPVFNWTGFYLGVHAGWGWADGEQTDPGGSNFDTDADGFVGGGQLGFNWQLDSIPIVLGVEGDVSLADLDDETSNEIAEQDVDMLYSIRGRAGFALDRLMPFATVGWGFADAERESNIFDESDSQTHDGLVYGGGFEWAWSDHLTVRGEYLHYDLGKERYDLGGIEPQIDLEVDVLRAALNWRF